MRACILGTGDSEVSKTDGVPPHVTWIAAREAGIGKQPVYIYNSQEVVESKTTGRFEQVAEE